MQLREKRITNPAEESLNLPNVQSEVVYFMLAYQYAACVVPAN